MTDPARLPLVDAVKAVGAQLIVLHHLAWYGPLGDTVAPLAPALFDWLTYHARLAVQAFLVVGGLLAAASLAPAGVARFDDPLARIGRRWRRLSPTYLCALALALAAGAFARALIVHEAVPSPPTWGQVFANAAMLQDVLGIEALSAGAWYVAIDLQLYAMGVALLWLGARPPVTRALGPWAGPLLVCALGVAGLYGMARDDAWEPWGLHYVGAWALGAAAWWAARTPNAGWAWLLAALAGGAWLVHGGLRLGVAVAVGIALCVALRSGLAGRWPGGRAVGWLAERSYALFLVHYPVCLAVNAAVSAAFPGQPWPALAGFVLAWAASNVAAVAVYRWVERPASAARLSRRADASS